MFQRREWLPTPVFWPGEFHGLYSPWSHRESDVTEWLSLQSCLRAFPGGSGVKNFRAMQETQIWSLGHKDPLEKGMATHSSTLENCMDRGACQAIAHGATGSNVTEWLTLSLLACEQTFSSQSRAYSPTSPLSGFYCGPLSICSDYPRVKHHTTRARSNNPEPAEINYSN